MVDSPLERSRTIEFGREIVLTVDTELDEFGQFCVAVSVDGKERWAAHFTDKAEDSRDA